MRHQERDDEMAKVHSKFYVNHLFFHIFNYIKDKIYHVIYFTFSKLLFFEFAIILIIYQYKNACYFYNHLNVFMFVYMFGTMKKEFIKSYLNYVINISGYAI